MTTKTKDATSEEAAAAEAVNAAKAELRAIRDRAQERDGRVHELRTRLLGRGIEASQEFDQSTGQPRPNTEARKIADAIEKELNGSDFSNVLHGAEQRLERAERELREVRTRRARDLLVEMRPDAEQAVERWLSWAAEGEERLRELSELTHRATGICVEARMWEREVPNLDHYSRLHRELSRSRPPLPLPQTLVAELKAAEDE